MTAWMARGGAACVVAALVAAAPVRAAEFNMDVNLDGVKLGKSLLGPEVSAAAMKGKVVLLEFWGVNCPPCLQSLPKLAGWYKELAPSGLVIVGAHAQGGTDENVKAVARSRGVNFPVVANAQVSGGNDFTGIPHVMLFDHTGKCLFRGSPFEVEKPMRNAIAKTPAGMMEGRELKKLTSVAVALRRGQTPGSVLAQVKKAAESKDEATAEEGKFVLEKITGAADKLLADAKENKASDPAAANAALARLTKEYAGTDAAKEGVTLAAEWKKDKAFQAEVAAADYLAKIKEAEGRIKPAEDTRSPAFRQANGQVLGQIAAAVTHMKKAWPDSKFTSEAMGIADKYYLFGQSGR